MKLTFKATEKAKNYLEKTVETQGIELAKLKEKLKRVENELKHAEQNKLVAVKALEKKYENK